MMKKMTIDAATSKEELFSRRVVARLDASAQDLPHDISERLRVARLRALDKHRLQLATETALLPQGGSVAALGPQDAGGNGLWPRLIALLPMVAVIAGLIVFQVLDNDRVARELAELDAAILTDDLPPDAYADPGFAQFLRARGEQIR